MFDYQLQQEGHHHQHHRQHQQHQHDDADNRGWSRSKLDMELIDLPRSDNHKTSNSVTEEKLDTYSGVFLPCLAQIVGVIFFLRLPTITGQAGIIATSLIVTICVISTFVTSLSLSAIASNGTILAGGPYYIISRTLGVEIGGALGLLFYLGTTLGASMHVMGAVETLTHRKKHAYQAFASNAEPATSGTYHPSLGLIIARSLQSCPQQLWTLLLMLGIAKVVAVGSTYVTKMTNFFLATVGLSILSIVLGTILFALGMFDGSLSHDEDRVFNDNLFINYSPDPKTGVTPTFWGLVAMFYPACTGILAGCNRSSKLATPTTSIPIGTIGAIVVTTLLYFFQVWLIGGVVNHETLIFNKLVLASVAYPSRLMAKIGMVTSCFGAALQCMAGAPQLLAAIAADEAIPFLKFLTKKKKSRREKSGKTQFVLSLPMIQDSTSTDDNDHDNENFSMASEKSADVENENSTRAIWFTWAIASLGTLLGNIDKITPILTMFYLMMYGGINLCCFLLAWVDSPGFRPQFKYFSRKTALFGFFWCASLAFAISWVMALLAVALVVIIFKYIAYSADKSSSHIACGNIANGKKSHITTNWGDVFDSVRYKITTAILARVSGTENFHAKNWRPQLLTLVDTDEEGKPLNMEVLALAAQFKGGRGLNMLVSIKYGSFLRKGTFEASQECNSMLKKYMEKERLKGFSEVVVTQSNFAEAVWSAVMHSGLGPVSPNTVLLSWISDWRQRINVDSNDRLERCTNMGCRVEEYVDALKGLGNMQRAICILKGKSFPNYGDVTPPGSTIDIYWIVDDGGLCLLLSYIISRNPVWRLGARLRVFAVTAVSDGKTCSLKSVVVNFLQQIRINAEVQVVSVEDVRFPDDFRACLGDEGPSVSPTLTIEEKFVKDNLFSAASTTKGQLTETFIPLDDDTRHSTVMGIREKLNLSGYSISSNKHHFVALEENTKQLSPNKFLTLEMAQKFNSIIQMESQDASLVVTHLPLPHKATTAAKFMEYMEAIFQDIDNMLLIQGSGMEYLTTVA